LEDPFDGVSVSKEKELEEKQIRSLTDSIVFCPKCGSENFFVDDPFITQYFCKKCQVKLTEIWDNYYEGKLTANKCPTCQQNTFENLRYCIACGKTGIERREGTKKSIFLRYFKSPGDFLNWLTGSGKYSPLHKLPNWVKGFILICSLIALIVCIIFLVDFINVTIPP